MCVCEWLSVVCLWDKTEKTVDFPCTEPSQPHKWLCASFGDSSVNADRERETRAIEHHAIILRTSDLLFIIYYYYWSLRHVSRRFAPWRCFDHEWIGKYWWRWRRRQRWASIIMAMEIWGTSRDNKMKFVTEFVFSSVLNVGRYAFDRFSFLSTPSANLCARAGILFLDTNTHIQRSLFRWQYFSIEIVRWRNILSCTFD